MDYWIVLSNWKWMVFQAANLTLKNQKEELKEKELVTAASNNYFPYCSAIS